MNRSAELLFNYLHDIIYAPTKAQLDIDELDADFCDLGEGLKVLADMIGESRTFAAALARGELDVPLPQKENELSSSLKTMHAGLKHLTWQAEQVAKGDYGQRVDFMGEFSASFNAMIEQLEARRAALEAEIESGKMMTKALEQSNLLLSGITANIPQMIIVLNEDGIILFSNHAGEAGLAADHFLRRALLALMQTTTDVHGNRAVEITTEANHKQRYYSIIFYPLCWHQDDAVAFVVVDISVDRKHMLDLEEHVYFDPLTKLHNRLYGMEHLQQLVNAGQPFTLCFVDLDNLKYVNDNFGHKVGDCYIIDAAAVLDSFGDDIIVCRIGGDEFMLLWPGSDAAKVTEKMKECCRQLMQGTNNNQKPYIVSLSYGIVDVPADTALSPSEVLAIADERMYLHKRKKKHLRNNFNYF